MTAAEQGVLAIWSSVAPAALADFRRWHRDEHLPERLALPGFLEASRYRSLDRGDHFLTLYSLDHPGRCEGEAYTALLQNPSVTTAAMLGRATRLLARAVYTVRRTSGHGTGGVVALCPDYHRLNEHAGLSDRAGEPGWLRLRLLSRSNDADLGSAAPRAIVAIDCATTEHEARATTRRIPSTSGAAPELFALEALFHR